MKLMCCPPWMAGDLWHHVRPLAGAALDRTDLGSLSELDTDVLSGRALLWIVHSDGRGIECAAVTQIQKTQASKVCMILACGGSGAERWKHLLSGVEEYAKSENCDAVRFTGRKGWKRIYPEYREIGAVFERRLDG